MKSFEYVNAMGIRKKLTVYPMKEGKYPVSLWIAETGENCGMGTATAEEIKNFLAHYGINATI